MGYPSMYLSVPDEWGFCFTQAFQSIGLGLATAIGAALAQPDRLPVAALGDGGALMGVAELDTVVRLGLPMVVVVYNDDAYGAEVHHFGPHGHRLDTVEFPRDRHRRHRHGIRVRRDHGPHRRRPRAGRRVGRRRRARRRCSSTPRSPGRRRGSSRMPSPDTEVDAQSPRAPVRRASRGDLWLQS